MKGVSGNGIVIDNHLAVIPLRNSLFDRVWTGIALMQRDLLNYSGQSQARKASLSQFSDFGEIN